MKITIFLMSAMIFCLPDALFGMQTAEETPRPPVELIAEAIRKHDVKAFVKVADDNFNTITREEWQTLDRQNSELKRAREEVLDRESCWRQMFCRVVEDEQITDHKTISRCIDYVIKERRKEENAQRLAKLEKAVENIETLLTKCKLVQEQPQIVSEDIKQ